MNIRKKVLEKPFKIIILLLFALIVCSMWTACSNPSGSSNNTAIDIDWEIAGDILQPPARTTISVGESVTIELKNNPSGSFRWWVNAVEQAETGNSFEFDSTRRIPGTYNIAVWAATMGCGQSIDIKVTE